METEIMPKQRLHQTAALHVGLRCEYLRFHWFSRLRRSSLLTLAVLLLSALAARTEVVEIRPALIETDGVISVEYRSGSTDRKSTRLNSSHLGISYAVFCL